MDVRLVHHTVPVHVPAIAGIHCTYPWTGLLTILAKSTALAIAI